MPFTRMWMYYSLRTFKEQGFSINKTLAKCKAVSIKLFAWFETWMSADITFIN